MASISRAFQMILIIFMVASIPLPHSPSRITTGWLAETTMAAEQTSTTTTQQELESINRLSRLRGGGWVEKRQVPTGPDPLHHNSEPSTGP